MLLRFLMPVVLVCPSVLQSSSRGVWYTINLAASPCRRTSWGSAPRVPFWRRSGNWQDSAHTSQKCFLRFSAPGGTSGPEFS